MISRDTMIANMRKPARSKACQVESLPAPTFPFDPIERSRQVETVVMQGDKRRYYRVRHANFYSENGIITADAIGCNFLCAHCWAYGKNECPCQYGTFFHTSEVIQKLRHLSQAKGCNMFRISGSEPFLGERSTKHLAEIIRAVEGDWVIETNGFAIGYNPDLIDILEGIQAFVRITIKASDPMTFEKMTGAKGEFYQYPIRAIDEFRDAGAAIQVAFNPHFVNEKALGLPANTDIEYEVMKYYPGVPARMKARGLSQPAKPARKCVKSWKSLKKEGDEWGEV